MMRAYAARDAFLLGQKMMLSRERKEGIKEGMQKGKLEGIKEGIEKGMQKGKLEGIKEGMKKGIKERNYTIAKTLKEMKMDNASISKATGLSIEEIEKL